LLLCAALLYSHQVVAFQLGSTGTLPFMRTSTRSTSTSVTVLQGSVETAEFEFQEMRAQLDAMKRAGVASRDLDPTKRAELEGYVRQVVLKRPSSVPLGEIGEQLPQSTWRLALSTDGATLGDLPQDASIYLKFQDMENVDYVLQFSEKTFGLNSIKAKSKWTISQGPTDPGLVTFVYDKITTDAFGFQDMGVGFFGLLKGRSNYVESAYFDNSIWIERSFGPTGQDYLNVYVRED
jgi:hypothetical protein